MGFINLREISKRYQIEEYHEEVIEDVDEDNSNNQSHMVAYGRILRSNNKKPETRHGSVDGNTKPFGRVIKNDASK